MKTNIAKMKCKSSSKIEPKDERKSLRVLLPAIATKGLKTMNSTSKEESCFKKCVTAAINYHIIKQMEVEKATNNGHSRSENRPPNQIDNKSPIKQFTRIDKGTCSEMEREDQESCLPPVSIAAQDSRDELLPEKIVQDLKARKAELKQETTMLRQELQRCSTMCMHLVDDNKLLLDELKKMCDPRVIETLEAKNPAGKDTRTN